MAQLSKQDTPARATEGAALQLREAPFTNVRVDFGVDTANLPAMACLAYKFLSLKMTVGVISCPRETSSPPAVERSSCCRSMPGVSSSICTCLICDSSAFG